MIVTSESEMIKLGEELGRALCAPKTVELIGDVGAGKTTFVKGLAKALGIEDEITSPSFTISKQYQGDATLVHYDFYRLEDPGLMAEDLEESMSDENTITVVEWADTVGNVLPKDRIIVKIATKDDGTRNVEITK